MSRQLVFEPEENKENKETAGSGSKKQSNRWKIPFAKVRTEELSSKDVVIGYLAPQSCSYVA
jgi:hypothetical protein